MRNGDDYIITKKTATTAALALVARRDEMRKLLELVTEFGNADAAEFWRTRIDDIKEALAELGFDPEANNA